ncbi:MAG: NAD-dependent epimerase/dehydratase family protein [Saprospiraceae bacterium]
MSKKAIVTGGAGFIGSNLVDALIAAGWQVTVLDNFDPFYDESIKRTNVSSYINHPNAKLIEVDIRDYKALEESLTEDYDVMVHLAAKAGVRPSILDPVLYQSVNVLGTQNLLELSKKLGIKQFVFASSSSVYGVNPEVPWSEDDYVLQPISPYASSKISGELLGHVYSKLYGIRFIGLRFFTVCGPRQRPDLAIHKFAKKIMQEEPIPVFGDGSTRRDYTYVKDTVAGIISAMAYEGSEYEIINLGNNRTITLSEMIATIENSFGKKAIINRMDMQPGDVPKTFANIEKAKRLLNYNPTTPFETGIDLFRDWFLETQVTVG